MPDERIGKYEILRPIAEGGMAEILLARATGIEGFEKLVVIKRIRKVLAGDPAFVQMFLDEARLAGTLHHSNVVQVYDIGAANGSYFFAMEFLHGEDVATIMRTITSRGYRLPLHHAVAIMLGACAGLHYAHDRTALDGTPLNIVHRDVSPQNVFVTYDGGVKVVDFGIAKAARRLTETKQSTLKGKISYMSPEQCMGEPLDRRSDVFALGIMLWELTTSVRLFRRVSDFEIMKLICDADAPRPSNARANYPPALESIVMKSLARDPTERYPTARALALDLEEFARNNRLPVSSLHLEEFMKEIFQPRVEAWKRATSQGHVVEHVLDLLQTRATGSTAQAKTDEESKPAATATAADSPFPKRQIARMRIGAVIAVAVVAALSAILARSLTRGAGVAVADSPSPSVMPSTAPFVPEPPAARAVSTIAPKAETAAHETNRPIEPFRNSKRTAKRAAGKAPQVRKYELDTNSPYSNPD